MKTLTTAIHKYVQINSCSKSDESLCSFEDRTSKILEEVRSSFDQFDLQEKQLKSDLSSCQTTISNHKDNLTRGDLRYRQLNDNRQLLRSQAELEEKQQNLRELEEKTHGLK